MGISGVALQEEDNVLVGKPIPMPLWPPQLPSVANLGLRSDRPVTYSVIRGTAYTQLQSWFKKHACNYC